MSRMFYLFLGAVIGAGLIYGSLMYHLVQSKEGWDLVPKTSASFTDTYVDIRAFTVTDWTSHSELVAALIKAEKQNLMGESTVDQIKDSMGQMLNSFRR
ncbi:MAG: hypothetical protein SGJ20_09415 [Planctomycetota bacterium]|nr:hypothetical protein [Planctomycetota bacterium]